jgi:DNA-directed RNA polymerase specialized sigma subunit
MSKEYLNNKRFEEVIGLYLKDKETHEAELIGMIQVLVSNIVESMQFAKIEIDDAKQESIYLVLRILPNFNTSHGSAFNYFSTVIINNLKLMYTKQKKHEMKINAYGAYILKTSGDSERPKS